MKLKHRNDIEIRSKAKEPSPLKRFKNAGMVIAIIMLIAIGFMLESHKTSELVIENDSIKIEGWYGEEVHLSQIRSLQLIDSLPRLLWRVNGYSFLNVRKATYETRFSDDVKIILNSNDSPYIFIRTNDNHYIIYSLSSKRNEELFEQLNTVLKNYNQTRSLN